MKLAITIKSPSMDSALEPRFGRTPYFAICDLDKDEEIKFVENLAIQEAHGAGVMAAQTLIDQGAGAIACTKFGPNGAQALQQAGIQCFLFTTETSIAEVLQAYKNGSLANFS
jgi:predicted Fe-Mo cluster-binding NifX family protein